MSHRRVIYQKPNMSVKVTSYARFLRIGRAPTITELTATGLRRQFVTKRADVVLYFKESDSWPLRVRFSDDARLQDWRHEGELAAEPGNCARCRG